MGLHKIFKIVAAVLGIIGVVLAGIVWSLDGESLITELKVVDGNVGDMDVPGSISNIINIAFVVLGIILVLVIFFVLKGLFTGNAKNALIGIGAFLLVIGIAYVLSSGVETPLKDGGVLSAGGSRLVETGIKAFYILAITAIGLMFFSGIKKLIK